MAAPHSGSALADLLRKNLADLVTVGLLPYNVAETGGSLLELAIVTARLKIDEDADEDERDAAYAKALVAVLKEAVTKERMPIRRYRRVLKYVLPLKEEYLGKTIKERRTAAGRDLKDGKQAVKAGTIRTYYEPRALEDLARVLVEMETEYRGETLPESDFTNS